MSYLCFKKKTSFCPCIVSLSLTALGIKAVSVVKIAWLCRVFLHLLMQMVRHTLYVDQRTNSFHLSTLSTMQA